MAEKLKKRRRELLLTEEQYLTFKAIIVGGNIEQGPLAELKKMMEGKGPDTVEVD